MENFLIYIGKVSIAAGIFYLAYLVLFQKQKHFGFNRIYLPVSMLISFIIPVITFTTVKFVEMPVYESSATTFAYAPSSTIEYIAPAFEFEWYHYLFGLYLLGVVGFLFHLLFGHIKALHIIRTSKIQELYNQLLNITKNDIHPFSFFNKIVLSEKTLSNPDLEMIVSHEKIHVREKHTFDILFTEIMFLLQWFNPFAWLIKGAVRNNLEYKTDDEIAKIYDPQKYQLAMVALADKKEVAPFLTALNGSQLKNRIIMMKQKTENKFKVARQLIVLPLLAVLVMGLSNKEIKTEFAQPKAKVEVIVDGKVIPADDKNLAKVDFNNGIDSEEVIKALDIKNVIANSLVIDGEIQKLYIRTADYVAGTNREFEENTTRNIVLDENKDVSLSKVDAKESEKGKNVGEKQELKSDSKVGAFQKDRVIRGKITDKDGNPIVQANVVQYDKPGGRAVVGVVADVNGAFVIKLATNDETLHFSKNGYQSKEVNVEGKEVVDVKLEIEPKDDKLKENGSPSKEKTESTITPPNRRLPTEAEWENAASKNKIIRGKITDKDGTPLVQANVVQYNNRGRIINGVVTDNKGTFAIKLEPNVKALTISKKGYKSKEVNVEGKEEISVELEKDSDESNGSSSMNLWMGQMGVAFNVGNSKITSTTKEGLNAQISQPNERGDRPLIIVDGEPFSKISDKSFDYKSAKVEDFGKLINVAPENIESIEVINDSFSIAIYGEKAKDGVLLIKTKKKEGAINSIQELRQFIAREIVFPTEARDEDNDELNIRFYVRVNNEGEITDIGENIVGDGEILPVEEIVIVALRPKNVVKEKDIKNGNLMAKEAERVLNKLPDIDIPEAKGKILEFWFKFVLQDQ